MVVYAYPGARIELYIDGAWQDITTDVYLERGIRITRGRASQAPRVSTARTTLHIKNHHGRYTPENPRSPLYGKIGRNTKLRISVEPRPGTVSYRLTGRVPSWPQDWHSSGHKVWAQISVHGILYRLTQGKNAKPLKDALRRHIEANQPLLYWPLTDGPEALRGSEVMQGAQPARSIGSAGSYYQGQPNWGQGTLAQWHDPVVALPASTEGTLSLRIRPETVTTWTADHYRAGIGSTPDDFTVFDTGRGSDADPAVGWMLETDRTANSVEVFVLSLGETTSSVANIYSVTSPGIFDLSPHMLRLTTTANGASTDWELHIDGESVASGTYAVAHRAVSRIRFRWGAFASLTEPLALGHITYWGSTPPPIADTWRAVRGHEQERAGRRIERLCTEQGVPLEVIGSLDDTPPMGPQRPATFLEILDSCADVDGGVVYETREDLGLTYRTNRSKYNQGA